MSAGIGRVMVAAGVALGLALGRVAVGAEPVGVAEPEMTPREMAAEIRRLQARVEQLERQPRLPTQEEVNRTVERVMRDAEGRSHFFSGDGLAVNYSDGKLTFANADKSFLIHPWAQAQVRDTLNWRDGGGQQGGSDDTENGLAIRRARFGVDGNISREASFLFAMGARRSNASSRVTDSSGHAIGTTTEQIGGTPALEEFFVKYAFAGTPWAVRAGQMHGPLSHEPYIGSRARSIETSIADDIFANSDTYLQAITVIWDPGTVVRFEGGITDGIRSANTDFRDYPNSGNLYDWGVIGRVEYKAMGRWQDYNQLTALGNREDLLVFGVGADESEGGDTNSFTHTADVQYARPNGLLVYGAAFGRFTENNPGFLTGTSLAPSGRLPADTYEYGLQGQVAYLIRQKWEPYVRYEYIVVAGTPAGSENAFHELSAGVTYYIYGHNLKFTSRVMYLPLGIPVGDDANDVLISNGKGEVILSGQLQLVL